MGGFTLFLWAIRIVCFKLFESPRFLSGIGRDADAVDVIHRLAKFNGKTSSLTVKELEAPGQLEGHPSGKGKRQILSKSSDYSISHIKALFTTTPKMAWSTSLLVVMCGKEIVIVASAMTNKTQVVLDFHPRCITISCRTCVFSHL